MSGTNARGSRRALRGARPRERRRIRHSQNENTLLAFSTVRINQSIHCEGESHAHKESIISAPLKKVCARTVLNTHDC